MSMWRNDMKRKNMFMFPLKNVLHEGFINIYVKFLMTGEQVRLPFQDFSNNFPWTSIVYH